MPGPAAILLLAVGAAAAARPTDLTGFYAYTAEDVIEYVDSPEGTVRVHYSVEGPNQVKALDADDDGIPDLAQDTALEAELVLQAYADAGFRLPLSEEDMGLEPLGGSNALDFYLVDFDGTGDGQFGTDRCSGGVCSGYMMMENDFKGYGYPDLGEAVRTLSSHELFHGVQYAYAVDQPGWVAEGTATWAEYLYDPDSYDFRAWCGRVLEEPERALDRPPSGAFTGWEYGTALWFGFMDQALGTESLVALQEALAELGGDQDIDALAAVIADAGTDIETLFAAYASWNLAVGDRAGVAESYDFAADLTEVAIAKEGDSVVDDERIYPLATLYVRLDHAGGPLYWATADDPTGLSWAVHPVADGGADGPVADAVATGSFDGPGRVELADLDAGGVFVVVSHPLFAENSIAIDYCLGDADVASECVAEDDGDGAADTGGEEKGGCSSAGRASGSLWLGLLALVGLGRRRR